MLFLETREKTYPQPLSSSQTEAERQQPLMHFLHVVSLMPPHEKLIRYSKLSEMLSYFYTKVNTKNHLFINIKNSSSFNIFTPNFSASVNLDPGSSPATT